jgi:predicted acylesterase/phospholipase RssA
MMSFGTVARHAREALAVLVRRASAGAPGRLDAVPPGLQDQAEVPGFAGVRYRFPVAVEKLVREAAESVERERTHLSAQGHSGALPPTTFLAISGGGDKGAFAAGLLAGWSAAGTRPHFKVVTGVSTGGLIAPLAFLGSAYDARLAEIYTGVSARDIATPRGALAAVFEDALSDNEPLWRLVRRSIDRAVLDGIAAEYHKGRLLLVGTADLDARQGVVWNMTKIAASPHPQAADLFHRVLIASAAIPVAFPPVLIDVEVNGRRYQEMHVDGGTAAQVFFYPPALLVVEEARARGIERQRTLYVIRNSQLDADPLAVERRVMSIATSAIASLIQSQGRGDLYRLYFLAQRDGVDFNLAVIPQSFAAPHAEEFDTQYMRQLYELARTMAERGYPWEKQPPDYSMPLPGPPRPR